MGGTLPPGLTRAVWLSVVAHGVALVSAVALARYEPRSAKPAQAVLVTKLVRLGKERPEDLLPRKPAPPPAATPVAVAPKIEAEAAPKPIPAEAVPSAQERVRQLAQVSSALERLKGKQSEEIEGHPDGVPEGEVADLSRAIEGSRFGTEVFRCLKANYAIEGLSASAVARRSAVVVIRIDGDGRFIDHRLERGSGLAAFDRAVERAIRLCGKVSPPPVSMRQQVRQDGFEVEFRP